MNKKLRLLVTDKCPNKCPLCCNNQFDFEKIPVVERWDYDEISITGGEPLMFDLPFAQQLAMGIKMVCAAQYNSSPKIWLYTANFEASKVAEALTAFDGIVITPHKEKDIKDFVILNHYLLGMNGNGIINACRSLRLNLFADMKELLPENIDLSLWKIKDMEWQKDCPVPEGEDFRRIAKLW